MCAFTQCVWSPSFKEQILLLVETWEKDPYHIHFFFNVEKLSSHYFYACISSYGQVSELNPLFTPFTTVQPNTNIQPKTQHSNLTQISSQCVLVKNTIGPPLSSLTLTYITFSNYPSKHTRFLIFKIPIKRQFDFSSTMQSIHK